VQFGREYQPKASHKWTRVPLVVIDELHSISDQGRDFRSAYRSVWIELRTFPWFKNARKLGLSATMTPRAQKDVQSALNISAWKLVTGDFRRNNLELCVFPNVYAERSRLNWLLDHIEDPPNEDRNMMVFVPSIDRGFAWLKFLRSSGVQRVEFFHSNIADGTAIQERSVRRTLPRARQRSLLHRVPRRRCSRRADSGVRPPAGEPLLCTQRRLCRRQRWGELFRPVAQLR